MLSKKQEQRNKQYNESKLHFRANVRSANEINSDLNAKKELMTSSFEKVLDMCFKQITSAANINASTCLFEVPEFVLGYPLFNINECIIYILDKLKKHNYIVNYYFPKLIQVAWKKEESQEERIHNQLIAVMNTSLHDKTFLPFLKNVLKQKQYSKDENLLTLTNEAQKIKQNMISYEQNTEQQRRNREAENGNEQKQEKVEKEDQINGTNDKKKESPSQPNKKKNTRKAKPISQFRKNNNFSVLDLSDPNVL